MSDDQRTFLPAARFVRCRSLAIAALLLATSTPALARSQTIDTRTGAVITGAVTTAVFGQTFTAPVGVTQLLSFSFFMRANVPSGSLSPTTFRARLFAWNGSGISGPPLLQSFIRQANPAPGLWEEAFTLELPLAVTEGDEFAAIIVPDDGTQVHGRTRDAAGALFDSYAGGSALTAFCAEAVLLPECIWSLEPSFDRAFTATFAQVPEPSSAMLLLAAAGGLLVARRRWRGRAG